MITLDRCFAVFNDTADRLKIIHMTEIRSKPEMLVLLSPYVEPFPIEIAKIRTSSAPEPMLRKLPLSGEEDLYVWRTPWCIYHPPSENWIAILDSDKRESMPGECMYRTGYGVDNSLREKYSSLRKKMMVTIASLEEGRRASILRLPTPSAPPALPGRKPPTFVAAIIKRDAIVNKMVCSISLEEITETMKVGITPCFHLFEGDSLMRWIGVKGFCPTCMAELRPDDCLVL